MNAIVSVLNNISAGLFGGTVGGEEVTGAIPAFWGFLTNGDVLPFFLIGVAVALLLLAVRIVKGIFWGV